ncbi:unnamed protein product [Chilo suppressalis]|uniref:Uncharacterized protein n=1 Tax=Chilo suppressalis TaxID=168631 RepID=A0ABN8B6L8_CHISP|nr:unnamed protein product [Chilo suppressalis]
MLSEYGRPRDSDSESSGSPCAACAAELYRLPPGAAAAAHLADTLPAVESSAEDTSYSASAARVGRAARGGVERAERAERGRQPRGRRRRDHSRHSSAPTVRARNGSGCEVTHKFHVILSSRYGVALVLVVASNASVP